MGSGRSTCLCCIPALNMGLTLMVLFDLAVGGIMVISFMDVKKGSSPGYKELETIVGAYGALCACVGALGVLSVISAMLESYGMLTAYFWAILLKTIGSVGGVCAMFVLSDEVCFESRAIVWSLGFHIHQSLECDVLTICLAAPGALLFFIGIYELWVISNMKKEIEGSDDFLVFRKPLLYQYTERTGVPSLSPRAPENAGLYDAEAPTSEEAQSSAYNKYTGYLRR